MRLTSQSQRGGDARKQQQLHWMMLKKTMFRVSFTVFTAKESLIKYITYFGDCDIQVFLDASYLHASTRIRGSARLDAAEHYRLQLASYRF